MYRYFLFIFLNFIAFGQEFNQKNELGQKNGPWRGFYSDTKNLRFEGSFEGDIEMGTFIFYENTKEKRIIAKRVFESQGTVCKTTYFKGKFIVSEGKEINRQKEGKWIYYFENSNIILMKENYAQGKLHGKKIVFYKDGFKAEESTYDKGLLHGIYRKYGTDEQLLEEKNYVFNALEGTVFIYDYDGKVSIQGQYRKDRAFGIWKYYENGRLVKEENKDSVKKIKTSNTETN